LDGSFALARWRVGAWLRDELGQEPLQLTSFLRKQRLEELFLSGQHSGRGFLQERLTLRGELERVRAPVSGSLTANDRAFALEIVDELHDRGAIDLNELAQGLLC
jgi:hypothetical protein